MGGCASKDKKDTVVDGDAAAADKPGTAENVEDGATNTTADPSATTANGDAINNEGCVFFFIFANKCDFSKWNKC